MVRIRASVIRPPPIMALIVALLAGTSPVYAAGWTVVSSPNPGGSLAGYLYGVAPVSANDVWTVGDSVSGSTGIYQTLAEHWNGSKWSVVPSPNVAFENNYLGGAAAVSSSDVWATGYTDNGLGEQTLIEQWNGSAWTIVPSPNPGGTGIGQENFLGNVSADGANDVWAVGFYIAGANYQTLTVRWNGTSWSQIPSPSPNNNAFLNGVVAISSTDVWACGAYIDASNAQRTLIEHFDGTSWSVVTSPSLNTVELLTQMTASASNDVWAVGYSGTSDTTRHAVIEHWNGSAWSVVPTPALGTAYDGLNGVAKVAANNVWAVGYQASTTTGPRRTLTEQWNGATWSAVASPNKGSADNTLEGVGIVPGSTTAWTTGFYYPSAISSSTLIERHT